PPPDALKHPVFERRRQASIGDRRKDICHIEGGCEGHPRSLRRFSPIFYERCEAQFPLTTLLSREQVDADRVIKEQTSGILAQDVCSLFRKQRIGNEEGMGEIWFGHYFVLSRLARGRI